MPSVGKDRPETLTGYRRGKQRSGALTGNAMTLSGDGAAALKDLQSCIHEDREGRSLLPPGPSWPRH